MEKTHKSQANTKTPEKKDESVSTDPMLQIEEDYTKEQYGAAA